jgi:hypothetical protein
MSKTETVRQLAAAVNKQRIEHLASQMQSLREAELGKAEDLARMLEPLAQAMAKLTDETCDTLAQIQARSEKQMQTFSQQLAAQDRLLKTTANEAQQAALSLQSAGYHLSWKHYLITILTGIISAVIVSAFWLWLAPPKVQNYLDAKRFAEYLKPAVTEVLRRSRSK